MQKRVCRVPGLQGAGQGVSHTAVPRPCCGGRTSHTISAARDGLPWASSEVADPEIFTRDEQHEKRGFADDGIHDIAHNLQRLAACIRNCTSSTLSFRILVSSLSLLRFPKTLSGVAVSCAASLCSLATPFAQPYFSKQEA